MLGCDKWLNDGGRVCHQVIDRDRIKLQPRLELVVPGDIDEVGDEAAEAGSASHDRCDELAARALQVPGFFLLEQHLGRHHD